MKDENSGFFDNLIKGVLRILSWIYYVAIKFVDKSYRLGIRREIKISIPVISVGNITLGGTGKTPLAIFLAEYYQARGKKPAILIRGYGGDENRLLADELADISIFTGQDRVKNARMAVARKNDVIILDDAFQHRRIRRDYNIVVLDSVSLFGNKALVPRGILREPVSSLGRASAFVLTKADMIGETRKNAVTEMLKSSFPEIPIALTCHRPLSFSDVTGASYPVETIKGWQIAVVSGIGDPDYLAFLLERQGANIVLRRDYMDHYQYTQKDIDRISRDVLTRKVQKIIVTAKDYVKLKNLNLSNIEDKTFILKIGIDFIAGKEGLIAGLNSVISG
ncbi:MAG: tetraacyldisaccharide 4'-kinase [Candidatus Omnitrophica bacterium]|nr:tetraacyldisaccharide 4'-kinase [Candidatus Omnitrophota bacterium]